MSASARGMACAQAGLSWFALELQAGEDAPAAGCDFAAQAVIVAAANLHERHGLAAHLRRRWPCARDSAVAASEIRTAMMVDASADRETLGMSDFLVSRVVLLRERSPAVRTGPGMAAGRASVSAKPYRCGCRCSRPDRVRVTFRVQLPLAQLPDACTLDVPRGPVDVPSGSRRWRLRLPRSTGHRSWLR